MKTNQDPLTLLNQADWKRIQLKLLEYAGFKIGRLKWRTGQGVLPKGLSMEDIVIGAVQKTFEGAQAAMNDGAARESAPGVRRWNPESAPDLLEFLKAVVDSDVSHLVSSEEHRLTNYHAQATAEEARDAIERLPSQASDNPEQSLLRREREAQEEGFGEYFVELTSAFAHDPPVQKVLASYREQSLKSETIKPAAVARDTGMPIEEVRNAIKRLRRRVLTTRDHVFSEGALG
jgi:hypothetical protein